MDAEVPVVKRRTALACPVCGEHMDVITHESEVLNGVTAAMLGGDGRWLHKQTKPNCSQHPDWVLGWREVPITLEKEVDDEVSDAADR